MAKKKLTPAKAKEMLHNPPHGKPLTEKQRKFFGAVAGGAEPYKAQNGIEGTMDGLTNMGFNYNGAWGGPSMQMGGNLPGAVGFTYARTTGAAPSNGPYAKKTKASAQNGQEMKYYQAGLDFKPKTVSKDGSEIPVDNMGYWNPENVGNPVIIPSNVITMKGVNRPLMGISDTGDVQYMYPGEEYEFDGEYVTEYPMAKGGISINEADAHPLKKLDDLLNFTNYNDMAKAKSGKKLSKAQIGTYMSNAATPTYKPLDIRGMYDEIDYNLTGSTDKERRQLSALAQSKQSQPSNKGGMNLENLKQMGQMISEAGVAKKGKKIKKAQVGESTGPQLTPSAQNLQQQQMNWGQNFANQPTPNQSWGTSKQKVNWAEGIPIVGNIVSGIQKLKEEKEQLRGARQMNQLVDVQALASMSRPKQLPRHQYVRPEDVPFQPEQMVSSNVLAQDGAVIGGNPTEIMNVYNPGTMYTDLGYEPLNDAEKMKQFLRGGKLTRAQNGFETFMTQQGGTDIVNTLEQIPGLSDGGGDVGAGIGEAVGSFIPVPGAKEAAKLVGRVFGSALDQKAEKIKAAQERTSKSISNMVGQSTGLNIQNQFQSYMQNGGYAQIGTSVGADCVKKGTCKAEEAREKGYSAIEKASRAADIAGARMAALEARQIKQQNRADYADYINERLTGYGDKLKQKEFDAAYQSFAAQNPELAQDKLLYTLASKELPKLRNKNDYYLKNVLSRTNPQLGYDTLSLSGLMQAMQKGYGDSRGYLEAWNSGFRQQQNGGETSPYEWVSHTWQPQVITKFGEYTMSDLLKPPQDADMLRAGGHLKSYTPPSHQAMETYALGGDLQTHWGGYAEPLSQNPYLPDGGETVMFRGQSHDESDGRGNTGIGITYGNNPVEVERGEPAVKLKDGGTGENNLTVFGNIKITNAFADMLADPKSKGKKFKGYVADLSKQENKQNKLVEKSIEQINDMDVITSFDQLKLGTLQANLEGANAKLKDLADKKMNAAALQNAIGDSKEERLLNITDKGDVLAKKGITIDKAQSGKNLTNLTSLDYIPKGQRKGKIYWGDITDTDVATMKRHNPWYDWSTFNPARKGDVTAFQEAFNKKAEEIGSTARITVDDKLGQQTASARGLSKESVMVPTPGLAKPNLSYTLPKPIPSGVKRPTSEAPKGVNLTDVLGQALPYLRPSDVEQLDPNQLMGELYALSQNQVEPVYAQKFIPELATPHDVSLQDILNANQADYNATQRLTGYNPAAMASLNAQKYQANQKGLGEQFRLNQAEKERVYEGNRALLNQAKLQNLNILDQQYARQSEALSKTKATTQAALNSIASKYAQNKLDNRKLAVYENMYNYRYDPKFRLQNYQVAQWNTSGTPNLIGRGNASGGLAPGYEFTYNAEGNIIGTRKSAKDDTGRNGAILKALKNI